MNRKLWENLASLYSVHLLNYAFPLLTLPYLARVLGAAHWGELAFAEAYAAYVTLLIEYGFGLSASRDVAQVREDAKARSTQLAAVAGAQGLLAIGALLGTLLLFQFGGSLNQYRPLLPLAFALALARAINPLWYFQGIERMGVIAGFNLIVNCAAAAAIFVLVRTPQDVAVPLLVRAAAASVTAGAAFLLAYRDMSFTRPTLALARRALAAGGALFLYRSAVSLYTTANVLILALVAPPVAVAWFAGAEKIAKAAVSGLGPITQSFYPRISYLLEKDRGSAERAARFSTWLTIGTGAALGLFLACGAPWLVKGLLGSGFAPSVAVLRWFGLLPPLIAASNVFGVQWMFALRLERQVTGIIVAAGVLNLLLSLLLAPRYREIGMAVSVVGAESFIVVAIVILLYRRQLGPWNNVVQARAATA